MSSEIDLGMALIRVALGPMLVLHGANKVVGGSLEGTTTWFKFLGLRPAWLHARLAAATEIGAGILLTLGLLTGLACAAFVGLMLVATRTDHRGKGFFVFKGGWEYTVLIAIVAVAVATVGPGRWSLDHVFGLDFSGTGWAVGATLAGSIAAFTLMALCYRPATDLDEGNASND